MAHRPVAIHSPVVPLTLASSAPPLSAAAAARSVCQCLKCGTLTMMSRCPNCDVPTHMPGAVVAASSGAASAGSHHAVGSRPPSRSGSLNEAAAASRGHSPHVTGPPTAMPPLPPSASGHGGYQSAAQRSSSNGAAAHAASGLVASPSASSRRVGENGFVVHSAAPRDTTAHDFGSGDGADSVRSASRHELQELWRTIRRQNDDLERARAFESELNAAREDVLSLTAERNQLRMELAAAREADANGASRDVSATRDDALRREVEELRRQEASLKSALDDAEARWRQAEDQLIHQRRKVQNATDEVVGLQKDVALARRSDQLQLQQSQAALAEAQRDLTEARGAEQRALSLVRTLESEVKTLRADRFERDASHGALEAKLTEANSLVSSLRSQLSRIESDLELERAERHAISDTLKRAQQQISRLASEKDLLDGRLEALDQENATYRSSAASLEARLRGAMSRVEVAEAECQRLIAERADINAPRHVANASTSPAKDSTSSSRRPATGAVSPVATVQSDASHPPSTVWRQLDDALLELSQSHATIRDQSAMLRKVERDNEALLTERDRAMSQARESLDVQQKLRNELRVAEEELARTRERFDQDASANAERLSHDKDALKRAEAELLSSQKELARRLAECDRLRDEAAHARQMKQGAEDEAAHLRQSLIEAQDRLAESRGQHQSAARNLDDTRSALSRVQAELAAYLESGSQTTAQLRAQVLQLSYERDSVKMEADQLRKDGGMAAALRAELETATARHKEEVDRQRHIQSEQLSLLDTVRRDLYSARLGEDRCRDEMGKYQATVRTLRDLFKIGSRPAVGAIAEEPSNAGGVGAQPQGMSPDEVMSAIVQQATQTVAERDRAVAEWRRTEEILRTAQSRYEDTVGHETNLRLQAQKAVKDLQLQFDSVKQSSDAKLRDVFGELTRERDSLQGEIEAVQRSLAHEKDHVARREGQLHQMQSQLDAASKALKAQQDLSASLERDKESLSNALRETKAALESVRNELQSTTHQLQQLDVAHREQGKLLSQAREDKDRLVQDVSKTKAAANDDRTEMQARIDDAKAQHIKEVDTLRANLRVERDKVLREIERAHLAESLANELKTMADTAAAERDRMSRELEMLRSSSSNKTESLSQLVDTLTKERDAFRRQAMEQKDRSELFGREVDVLKNDKSTLETALSEAVKERDHCGRLASQAQAERDGALRLLSTETAAMGNPFAAAMGGFGSSTGGLPQPRAVSPTRSVSYAYGGGTMPSQQQAMTPRGGTAPQQALSQGVRITPRTAATPRDGSQRIGGPELLPLSAFRR